MVSSLIVSRPDLAPINDFLRFHGSPITNNGLNLRPLKAAVAQLPNYAPIDSETKELLDLLWAMVFHYQAPLRVHLTKEWFAEHYVPGNTETFDEETNAKGRSLLEFLGLPTSRKAPPDFKRRI